MARLPSTHVYRCHLCGGELVLQVRSVGSDPAAPFSVLVEIDPRQTRHHLAGHKAQLVLRERQNSSVVTDAEHSS